MKSEKQKNNKNTIIKLLFLVFIVGFLICIGIFIGKQIIKNRVQQQMADMASASAQQQDDEKEGSVEPEQDLLVIGGVEVPNKYLDWSEIQEQNEDIYAWIYIPGTEVDYPILQHPTDNSYYLNHNLDGSAGYPGCIYTENMNTTTFTDNNTVIYGHDMKDGSMFASLHQYRDSEFFQTYPYIFIYTPSDTYVYEIYTACEFGDEHLLYAYDFTNVSEYGQFLSDVVNARSMDAQVRRDIAVTTDDKVITLSTCIDSKPNNRYLVTAVRIHD